MGEETPSEASDLTELATLVAQIAGVIEQGMVLTRPMVTRIAAEILAEATARTDATSPTDEDFTQPTGPAEPEQLPSDDGPV